MMDALRKSFAGVATTIRSWYARTEDCWIRSLFPWGWGPRDFYLSDAPPPAIWSTIRHQAMLAAYFKTVDAAYAEKCKQVAQRVWRYMTSDKRRSEKYKAPALPPLGHDNMNDWYAPFYPGSSFDLAHRLCAAVALYRVTNDPAMLEDAARSASALVNLQVTTTAAGSDDVACFWEGTGPKENAGFWFLLLALLCSGGAVRIAGTQAGPSRCGQVAASYRADRPAVSSHLTTQPVGLGSHTAGLSRISRLQNHQLPRTAPGNMYPKHTTAENSAIPAQANSSFINTGLAAITAPLRPRVCFSDAPRRSPERTSIAMWLNGKWTGFLVVTPMIPVRWKAWDTTSRNGVSTVSSFRLRLRFPEPCRRE